MSKTFVPVLSAMLSAALCLSSIGAYAQNVTSGPLTSYRYAGGPVSTFATNPTDVVVVTGGSGKSVRFTKISVCGQANASTTIYVALIKHSTADSGGTATGVTAVNLPGTNVSATSSGSIYTANPTLGTVVGNIDVKPLNVAPAGAAQCTYFDYGTSGAQAPTLLGASQQLAINFGAAAMPSGLVMTFLIEVTEQ